MEDGAVLRTVGSHEGNGPTRPGTPRVEAAGNRTNVVHELAGGDGPARRAVDQYDSSRLSLEAVKNTLGDRAVPQGNVVEWTLVDDH